MYEPLSLKKSVTGHFIPDSELFQNKEFSPPHFGSCPSRVQARLKAAPLPESQEIRGRKPLKITFCPSP